LFKNSRESFISSQIGTNIFRYPVSSNLNSLWCFGFLSGFFLITQIISGLLLTLHYIPDISLAYDSIRTIMREVPLGWLIRYTHVNGASFFFIAIYLHMFKNFYYGSFIRPRQLVWNSGFVGFFLLIVIAFLGYVLPWGQMSYWGATVISGLISTVPIIGDYLLLIIWAGENINTVTLHRFYTLHYLLPFVLLGLVVLHIFLLHNHGSNNPIGKNINDNIKLHPQYTLKDSFVILIFIFFFIIVLFFNPTLLCNPINVIVADTTFTPKKMVPEWYFLPLYTILRSIDSRGGGVCLLLAFIVVMYKLPNLVNPCLRNSYYKLSYSLLVNILIINFIILGICGSQSLNDIWLTISRYSTVSFFILSLIVLPLYDIIYDASNHRYNIPFSSYFTKDKYNIIESTYSNMFFDRYFLPHPSKRIFLKFSMTSLFLGWIVGIFISYFITTIIEIVETIYLIIIFYRGRM